MAEAAGAAVPTPLLPGLPDEISIWEILVRLPPKDLLRCRAVCPAWRRATSTHDFLLAHHACQPLLPLLCGRGSLYIISFDNRAGLTAADRFRRVARLDPGDADMHLEASCDGLLVFSINNTRLCICNPATREYAPLPLHHRFILAGLYQHPPTGEYRLLLYKVHNVLRREYAYHVFTIGSGQPPRHVGLQDFADGSFLFHGSLHWCKGQMIIVFDITTELFRQMRSPILSNDAGVLFEMDGMLSVYRLNDASTSVDILVLEDYKSEVWAFKCRVELPVDEFRVQLSYISDRVVARSFNGGLLVLARLGDWLLQIDSDSKVVASFHSRGLDPSRWMLKQSLVRHTFFPTLEGYVVNASPFT